MKAIVKVVGIGERRKGVSTKTGKPYDFVKVACTFDDGYMAGQNAFNCSVDGDEVERFGLHVGGEYEAVIGYRNYQPSIIAIIG